MSQDGGYYSLIQFCPDPSRLEGVNIGVVLYSSSERRLKVRITRDNRRIRKVFGNQDWNLLSRARASIESHLRSEQFPTISDLESYIAKRANIIQLTAPRPMHVTDLEDDLNQLHNRLVGTYPPERKHRIAQAKEKYAKSTKDRLPTRPENPIGRPSSEGNDAGGKGGGGLTALTPSDGFSNTSRNRNRLEDAK
jgi:hypothetical protein